MKVLTVVGARPQFIKAAAVRKALAAAGHQEFLVHTGQHYDYGMSQVFFEELGLPEPDVNLGVGSGSHGRQTGQMLIQLEEVMQAQRSDWVLVYMECAGGDRKRGDCRSRLAARLAIDSAPSVLWSRESGGTNRPSYEICQGRTRNVRG